MRPRSVGAPESPGVPARERAATHKRAAADTPATEDPTLVDPTVEGVEDPTLVDPGVEDPTREYPTVVDPAPDAPGRRSSRGLDRREIQDLDIAEPPTVRLGRSRARPPADGAEDQLTMRLDRPD